jgi:SM-20-related protein
MSGAGRAVPFWKMDLDGEPAIDAVWKHARETCAGLAGAELEVARVYANGHTYGQGGRPHQDDNRPGAYTLLWYPMPEWRHDWDGETVFFEPGGEIARSVRPAPNRAVLFDSRIGHAARPPSRYFVGLRITIAFKLMTRGDAATA